MSDLATREHDSWVDDVRRSRELLLWVLLVVAILVLVASFLPLGTELQLILRGFAISLAPAVLVTLFLTRYASGLTRFLIREAVDHTLKGHLELAFNLLEKTVASGIQEIGGTVATAVGKIDHDLENLAPFFASAARLGLEDVRLTRALALDVFSEALAHEVDRAGRGEPALVWIVSSSIKGFLEASSEKFDGRKMMQKIARCECDLRILMTDPAVADLRAKQEGRDDGAIPREVQDNLGSLKRAGVSRQSVKLYSGTPTVFAVATTDKMLLNPYPYQREAFRCFSLIIHKTASTGTDIYRQYREYHFEEPWKRAKEISEEMWKELRS